jgi:hypothetical protein
MTKPKSRFFFTDHGIDNYEEHIDLSKVIFIVSKSVYRNEVWTHYTTFLFENGLERVVQLSDHGRDELSDYLYK